MPGDAQVISNLYNNPASWMFSIPIWPWFWTQIYWLWRLFCSITRYHLPFALLQSRVKAGKAGHGKTRTRGLHPWLWLRFPLCCWDPYCSAAWVWPRQGWWTSTWPMRQMSLSFLPLSWQTVIPAPHSMSWSLLIYTVMWPLSQNNNSSMIWFRPWENVFHRTLRH